METETDDCVFCNIVQRSIPAQIYYEDADILVVQDILPKAPVHLLVISKRHISSLNATTEADEALLGKMVFAGKKVAGERGVAQSGYRISINIGKEGSQVIPHLHMHVLGGKQLAE